MSSDLFRRLTAFKLELADIEEVIAVPDHEEGKHQFYKLRSQIAHGSSLLLNEFGGMGGGTAAQMQDSSKEDLHVIVRLALRNWLIPEIREAIESQAVSDQ